MESLFSSVRVATRPRVRLYGVRIPTGQDTLLQNARAGCGAHAAPAQSVPAFFPRVKRPGRDADHSHPRSAEGKTQWSCAAIPAVCLHVVGRTDFTRRRNLWGGEGRKCPSNIFLPMSRFLATVVEGQIKRNARGKGYMCIKDWF